jgi:hypothetical protein
VVAVGVNRVVPPRAWVPLQPPLAVQEVALVVLQLRVTPCPTTLMLAGIALIVMIGG